MEAGIPSLRVIADFTKTLREKGLIDKAWIPVFPSIHPLPPALSESSRNPTFGSATEILPDVAEDVEMQEVEEDEVDEDRDDPWNTGKGSDAG